MGITRRSFLQGAVATGAAVSAVSAASVFTTDLWLREASAKEEVKEHTACTYHQSHCGGMCPMKCTVREGRLALIEPNTCTEDRYETICLKGISEIQHIYSDHRIQSPLKRVGERGSGEFKPISWDEALDEVVNTIKTIQERDGKDAVMVTVASEPNYPFLAAMLGAQTGGFTGIDTGVGNGLDPAIGHGGGYAMATGEARDWVNARMVLTVGSNFCESSLPQVRLFFEAKEAGAKMVTVDPHFSTTAAKSNQWIPVEPGTDAALFLGMISVILDEDLGDKEFMRDHTSLPYLVYEDTGMLVRRDMSEEARALTGAENPFMVIDAKSGDIKPYDKATAELSGAVIIDGKRARTVYDHLLETQKPYTVEWAAEKTGADADVIAELAREYAIGPSTIALGWGGNDKMGNSDIAGHAAALLCALTGNICKPGANVGVFVGGNWNGHAAALGSWALPEDMVAGETEMSAYDMRIKKNKVKAYICCGDHFAQHFANMDVTRDWAERLEFIVTIDPYFTEGAKFSDIILPATSRFENDEEFGNIKAGYNHLLLQQKVIDPLFDAKTDFWIQKEIAKRLGVADALPPTAVDMVEAMISTSSDPYINSLTLDKIVENNCVWPMEGIDKPRQEFADLVFNTPSTRMDVYYENMIPFHQTLPEWEECIEAYKENPLRKTYPLQLANVRTRFRIHNQFNDATWIQQYCEPLLDVNPEELKARGLETGDLVECFNDRGSFKCRVHGNDSIRPGSVRMWEGSTADFIEEGNLQSVTNDTMLERGYEMICGPVIPFSDTLVEIKKA